jgi:sugar/nucleoside kinase (ribokinase family)
VLGLVGSVSLDLVAGAPPRPGGAVYYAAEALRLLGRPASIVAKCAPADRARFEGLDAVWRPAAVTSAFSFSYEGDVRQMAVEAVGDPWRPDDVEAVLDGVAWVHAGGLLRSDFPAETLAALGRGRSLSLAGHSLVRVAETGPLRLDPRFDPRALEHVDILFLSEEEAAVLPLGRLGVAEIVVTLGSRGSRLHAAGQESRIEIEAVEDADPTGAGDMFAAGYLAARSDGAEPVEAARRASELVSDALGRR